MFLELGGKSAAVVLDDVNPAVIVPTAVGVCVHAGQACAATSRMLIHRSLYGQAVADITAPYQAVPVGDPVDPGTFVGPVISAAQKDRVLTAIDEAREAGAVITVGGGPAHNLPAQLAGGHFVAPTVVVGVDNSAAIAQQEVFGPVLVLLPFDDDDEAVRIANDSAFGLAGAVMSRSADRGMSIARRVRTGSFGVNGGMFYGADAPFGGYKSSGVGRQCGIEGLGQYLSRPRLSPAGKAGRADREAQRMASWTTRLRYFGCGARTGTFSPATTRATSPAGEDRRRWLRQLCAVEAVNVTGIAVGDRNG